MHMAKWFLIKFSKLFSVEKNNVLKNGTGGINDPRWRITCAWLFLVYLTQIEVTWEEGILAEHFPNVD